MVFRLQQINIHHQKKKKKKQTTYLANGINARFCHINQSHVSGFFFLKKKKNLNNQMS